MGQNNDPNRSNYNAIIYLNEQSNYSQPSQGVILAMSGNDCPYSDSTRMRQIRSIQLLGCWLLYGE